MRYYNAWVEHITDDAVIEDLEFEDSVSDEEEETSGLQSFAEYGQPEFGGLMGSFAGGNNQKARRPRLMSAQLDLSPEKQEKSSQSDSLDRKLSSELPSPLSTKKESKYLQSYVRDSRSKDHK